MEHLVEHAERGRLVIFAGAGISMIQPTGLPSWWEVNEVVLTALATRVGEITGEEHAQVLASHVIERMRSRKLPPEFQAELIAQRLRKSYFEVLQCLDSDQPNQVHNAMAMLAKAGHARAILTTNFDRAIEAAFQANGTLFEARSQPDRFADLVSDFGRLEDARAPCQLLKLHGSAEDPASLIDTLAQRKAGFPSSTTACVRHLIRFGHWLFLGYSGADLEAEANYLHLRGDADTAIGFTWLVRPGEEPATPVTRLKEIYDDRAFICYGELPEWIEALARHVLAETPSPKTPCPQHETSVRRREASDRIVLHAQHWASEQQLDRCVIVLADLLRAAGRSSDALKLVTRLYDETPTEKRRSGHFGIICDWLANLHEERGDPERALALFREGLKLFDHIGGEEQRWAILNNMTLIAERQGAYDRALEIFDDVLATVGKSGSDYARGIALHNLAMVHVNIGNLPEAVRLYEEELGIVQRLGDERGRAQTLNNLGEALVQLGDFESGLMRLNDAFEIRERLGDDLGLARTLGNIAGVHHRRGEYSEALATYARCRRIFQRFEDAMGLSTVLANLADIAAAQDREKEAADLLNEALRIAEKIGSKPAQARVFRQLAELRRKRGRIDETLQLQEQALAIYEQGGSAANRRDVLIEIGTVRDELGQQKQAEASFREAVSIAEEVGEQWAINLARNHLAKALNDRGLFEQDEERYTPALQLFQEALKFHRRLVSDSQTTQQRQGALANCGQTLQNIGNIHVQKGRQKEALWAYSEAVELLEQAGVEGDAIHILCNIAYLHGGQRRSEQMLAAFRRAEVIATYDQQCEMVRDGMDDLAQQLIMNGGYDLSLMLFEQCLRINEKLANAAGAAATKFNMGQLLLHAFGDSARALTLLEEAREEFGATHSYSAAAEELIAECRGRL